MIWGSAGSEIVMIVVVIYIGCAGDLKYSDFPHGPSLGQGTACLLLSADSTQLCKTRVGKHIVYRFLPGVITRVEVTCLGLRKEWN